MNVIEQGGVTSPQGFQAAAVASGLKKKKGGEERPLDLALIYADRECTAAGVFTQNRVVAAPVLLDRETLSGNRSGMRAVVANAGNANACTGMAGEAAARGMQQSAAFALGVRPEQVLVLSTGVIGVPLPMPRVNAGIDAAARRLGTDHGAAVARALMTTDTFPKEVAVQVELPGQGTVTIGGMAKGAGMIHPNMATMLAVLTTDAAVPAGLLQELLQAAADASFNRISVDGDTSTNDTVLLLASGASGARVANAGEGDAGVRAFAGALTYACTRLAQMIVRDGEGATKFVEIRVTGAPATTDAVRVAQTIATSPLVKTALAGSDANWGRILAAAGRAGVAFAQEKTALWVAPLAASPQRAEASEGRPAAPPGNGLQLVVQGTPTDYEEEAAAAIFAEAEILIHLDLGAGAGTATVWTCDLSREYVAINADYRS